MTASLATVAQKRPDPSGAQQWWVLTTRLIAPTLRNGEVAVGVVVSVAATASLYIPLNRLMDGPDLGMSSYAQYLLPLIVLQAIAFASISTAFRAATDSVKGINRRFQSLPIASLTPLAARIAASVYRCAIGLVVALGCGYAIGFRFHRGPMAIAVFCLLVMLTGLALAFLADTIGANSRNPASTAQWLLLPQLIFGFLSVGIQPLHRFPGWIQPVVDNQPISRLVYAMQALAGDSQPGVPPITWSVLAPALAWVVGMIAVTLPWAITVYRRRS
ncbi:antibiotic transporter [Mycobacterium antarcticum]|uniref:ABC transporter permease n=1 Tax=unclassified Mycolicibacterium TaxID=2636767 RepID=UPI0023826F6A|nr:MULTISPECIES: ABC transporter permease [unclassified Mycolicibacterium]BDX34627.1 antibiotic transporter [Mycolicibacterium sp. TUM20985]GLP81769.1 antibiotic transporter [Mycolicibacterium sp. TUM20984]